MTTGTAENPRSQVPIISTSEAETTVKVKDGRTIFIAGLRQNLDQEDIDGMPYVSKIPILNLLFSRREKDDFQTEIIIFLTPHIITGGESRAWDIDRMNKYPKFTRPEYKGYDDEERFRIHELKEIIESED